MNFPDYKRFLEFYMGDGSFRERFDRAPAAALQDADLHPEMPLEFLRAVAAGCRSRDFRQVTEHFPEVLAVLRHFAEEQEECNPFTVRCRKECSSPNARFEAWRERKRQGNRAVLQPLYFDRASRRLSSLESDVPDSAGSAVLTRRLCARISGTLRKIVHYGGISSPFSGIVLAVGLERRLSTGLPILLTIRIWNCFMRIFMKRIRSGRRSLRAGRFEIPLELAVLRKKEGNMDSHAAVFPSRNAESCGDSSRSFPQRKRWIGVLF